MKRNNHSRIRSVFMKKKAKGESRIPTGSQNTNRKKIPGPGEDDSQLETSLFKKNEFALILFGALLLTFILFFVFFRSPDKPMEHQILPQKETTASGSFADLENRIGKIETALENQIRLKAENKGTGGKMSGSDEIDALQKRVARLETAFSVKFDSVLEQMGSIEKRLADMKAAAVTVPAKQAPKIVTPDVKPESKPPVKTSVKKETKAKAPMFHTVKKGDTLYSISKKYQISIPALRKLNKLSLEDKIYIGMNLLIR